jgi:L-asparagine oxygenase
VKGPIVGCCRSAPALSVAHVFQTPPVVDPSVSAGADPNTKATMLKASGGAVAVVGTGRSGSCDVADNADVVGCRDGRRVAPRPSGRRGQLARLTDEQLPGHTVLVPAHQEEVIGDLVRCPAQLDYPTRSRLRPHAGPVQATPQHNERNSPVLTRFAGLNSVALQLSGHESERLRALASQLAADLRNADLDSPSLLKAVEIEGRHLPRRITESLIEFRRNGNEYGTLVLKNLPRDHDLVATPERAKLQAWQRAPVSTMTQLLVMSWFGDVIAYSDEKDGALVQDIVPYPGAESRQENSGSVFLEMHTEDGFHPYKPDHLSLLCLRSDHDRAAYTLSASIIRALPRLSSECIDLLREPLYRIRYASSFSATGEQRYCTALPVLTGPVQQPELCVDFHAMEGLSEDAAWALNQLREAMTAVLAGAVLEPGDLIIVDNRAAVHARTDFAPRYDGHDRWLRRCFTVADLSRSRAARVAGSHVCAPLSAITRCHSKSSVSSSSTAVTGVTRVLEQV